MSLRIAPSILSADFGRLAEEVREAERGGADWIHVDVMDGHFVPNLTIGPAVTAAIRQVTDLPLDVHLMIEAPERYLAEFARSGANVLTVHQEACRHLNRTIEEIHTLGVRAGVALNPATPVDLIDDVVGDLDLVLIMSVNPGFGGQSYIARSKEKILKMRSLLGGRSPGRVEIEVDGGVSADTAAEVVAAGATVLVAGSAVYGHPDGVAAGIDAIRTASRFGDAGAGAPPPGAPPGDVRDPLDSSLL